MNNINEQIILYPKVKITALLLKIRGLILLLKLRES